MRHYIFAMRAEPVGVAVLEAVFELLGVSVPLGVELFVADALGVILLVCERRRCHCP